MVDFGGRRTKRLYLESDAEILARIGDVPVPSPADQLKYTPLGAVARAVKAKYLGEERLQDCVKRDVDKRFLNFKVVA